MTIKWTKEQAGTINYNRSKDLLISAAAGSGKTTVLTGRVVRRLLSGRIKPEEMLVMTFTELAALQMKQKIEQAVRDCCQDTDPAKKKMAEDLVRRLPSMQISTIHSFCKSVISDYIAELTDENGDLLLEPGYQVLKDEERQIVLHQAIDDVLGLVYRLEDTISSPAEAPEAKLILSKELPELRGDIYPFILAGDEIDLNLWLKDFRLLSDAIAPGYDDLALRSNLEDMLQKLRSMPNYREWLQKELKVNYQNSRSWSDSKFARDLFLELRKYLQPALEDLAELKTLKYWARIFDPKEKAKTIARLQDSMAQISIFLPALADLLHKGDDWNAVNQLGRQLLPITVLKKGSGVDGQEFNSCFNQNIAKILSLTAPGFVNSKNNPVDKYLEDVYPWFSLSQEEIETSLINTYGPLARFFELVLMVDQRYRVLKLRQNKVDFDDFEHDALSLLANPHIQEEYRQRFKEIYIDEYQDTSSIQEAVVKSFAQDNVLMVGDIKQSIYRFRHANPDLFRVKQELFLDLTKNLGNEAGEDALSAPGQGDEAGFLIRLNKNFRSLPGIIDFVNSIFSSFMTKESGEIVYDESESLIAGRADNEGMKARFLLALYSQKEIELTDAKKQLFKEAGFNLKPKKHEAAALFAVEKIKEILSQGSYNLKDIAVLAPNHHTLDIWRKLFMQQGINVAGTPRREFLDSPVLRQLEALVQTLDNSRQDIPLTALLLSGLLGERLSEEEMLEIKVSDRQEEMSIQQEAVLKQSEDLEDDRFFLSFAPFYLQLEKYAKSSLSANKELQNKLKKLLSKLEYWRLLSEDLTVSALLIRIIADSSYEDRLERQKYAAENLLDLESFLDWVEQLEQNQTLTINRLARYIAELRQKKASPEELSIQISATDAVQMMTVHGSKGLEFPIVFLAGLDLNYHHGDNYRFASISEEIGITSYSIDPKALGTYLNRPHQIQLEAEKMADKAEKWRLLYVALTRAKDRLYLADALNKAYGDIAKGAERIKEAMAKVEAGRLAKETLSGINNNRDLLFHLLYLSDRKTGDRLLAAAEELLCFPHLEVEIKHVEDVAARLYAQTITKREPQEKFLELQKDEIIEPASLWQQLELDPSLFAKEINEVKDLLRADLTGGKLALAPGKITVSELKRMSSLLAAEEMEAEGLESAISLYPDMAFALNLPDSNDIFPAQHVEGKKSFESKTDRRQETDLAGAKLGTVLHTVFQFLDFARLKSSSPAVFSTDNNVHPQDLSQLEEEYSLQLKKMVREEKLLAEEMEAALLFAENAWRFSHSKVGQRLIRAEEKGLKIFREQPFTLAIPALLPDRDISLDFESERNIAFDDEEITLLQGMIDLWFEDEEGIILIDFKSDLLPQDLAGAAEIIKERYQFQIRSYAEAIRRAVGKEVKDKIIWLIRPALPVSL